MAVNLNLLPQEYSVKTGFGAVARVVRSFTIVLLVVFLVFVIGVLAFFIISSFDLRRTSGSVESLKTTIKSLETTEQRLVLLKDRLGKIKAVTTQSSSKKSLTQIEPVLAGISEASVGELNIDSEKVDTSINFSSSAALGNFFRSIATSEVFKSITMTSFGFNPISGYLVSLRFIGK